MMELMINRLSLNDDSRGVGESLKEKDSKG